MTWRFDGISPNDRILSSRFDQVRATVARTAPGGEDAKQRMEICTASFVWKMIFTIKMSQNVEIVSNFQQKKFALEVRHNGPLTFIRKLFAFLSHNFLRHYCAVACKARSRRISGERFSHITFPDRAEARFRGFVVVQWTDKRTDFSHITFRLVGWIRLSSSVIFLT